MAARPWRRRLSPDAGHPDPAGQFAELLGPANVLSDPASLAAYGIDATVGYRGHPRLAIFPTAPAMAGAALALAARLGIPLTLRGGGTSLAAGATPADGSVVISTELLEGPPEISPDNLSVVCAAGTKTAAIDRAAAQYGLFLAPDPGARAISMIGGNVSTNAGGALALAYGVIRHHVLALQYATLDGQLTWARRGTPSEGLLELLIGAEGTLGLITQVELALLPQPPARLTLVASCANAQAAAAATFELLAAGLTPARIEFMDDVAIAAVQAARDRGLDPSVGAYLLVEFDGLADHCRYQRETALGALAPLAGVTAVAVAGAAEARYWEARHAITSSLARIRPGKIGEDICLPRSRVGEAVARVKAISAELDLPIALFGHIGDGTLHPNVLYDPQRPKERERVGRALAQIADLSVALGGVLSGEHGLGRVKRTHLDKAFDHETLAVFQRLRDRADPAAILNRPLQWVGNSPP